MSARSRHGNKRAKSLDYKREDWRASKILIGLIAAFGIAAVIFLSFPQIDIAVSSLFFDPNLGFWMNKSDGFQFLRDIYQLGYVAIILTALILLINTLIRQVKPLVPWQFWTFVVTSFAIGPGLIVNAVLKNNWGRARPAHVLEFGGEKTFSPALMISDQCPSNCAFTSGEGAAIFTAAFVLGIVILKRHTPDAKINWVAGIILAAVTLFGAGLRITMGRHFLSDTIFSALICAIVCLLLYRAFGLARFQEQVRWSAVRTDLRNLVRRSPFQ